MSSISVSPGFQAADAVHGGGGSSTTREHGTGDGPGARTALHPQEPSRTISNAAKRAFEVRRSIICRRS
jgi:hypothetical protein